MNKSTKSNQLIDKLLEMGIFFFKKGIHIEETDLYIPFYRNEKCHSTTMAGTDSDGTFLYFRPLTVYKKLDRFRRLRQYEIIKKGDEVKFNNKDSKYNLWRKVGLSVGSTPKEWGLHLFRRRRHIKTKRD
jgi:hypothetical protein